MEVTPKRVHKKLRIRPLGYNDQYLRDRMPDPIPGDDGKDAVITPEIKSDIASLIEVPAPIPGEPGQDAVITDEIKADIAALIPEPEPGKDAEFTSEIMQRIAALVPHGKPGKSVDVDKLILEVLKSVPVPRDGISPTIDYKFIINRVLELNPNVGLLDFNIGIICDTLVITKFFADGRVTQSKIKLPLRRVGGGGSSTGTGLMPYRVDEGATLTIPDGFSVNHCGPFENNGTLINNGRMCAL